MGNPRVCRKCGRGSFQRDESSSVITCSSCGIVYEIDEFVAPIDGVDATNGNLIFVGTTGFGSFLSYKDKKIFDCKNEIDDILTRLGFSSSISSEISAMVNQITDGDYGRGAWFPTLIGACAHVVLRKNRKPFPMAEIASALDCDVHELGRMIDRVVRHLGLDLPEFDIINFFKKTIQISPSFNEFSKDKIQTMIKQGSFLLQCSIDWFLTTGRKPMPMIVAVLMFVAEINHLKVRIEDIASENHAKIHTSKVRYTELLETLVKVAKVLPWGREITVKNIVQNAPFVLKYLEIKSQTKQKSKNRENFKGITTNDVIRKCSSEEPDEESIVLEEETASNENKKRKKQKSNPLFEENTLQNDVLPTSFVKGCVADGRRRMKIKMAKERIGKIMNTKKEEKNDECCSGNEFLEKNKKGIDWEDCIIETLLLHQVNEEEISKGSYKALLGLHVFNCGIV